MPLRFLIFLSVLTALVVSGHVYLYRRLVRDVTVRKHVRLVGKLVLAALATTVLFGRFLDDVLAGPVAAFIAGLSFVWMGVSLFLVLALLALDALRGGMGLAQRARHRRESDGPGAAKRVDVERRRVLSGAVAGGAWLMGGGAAAYGTWRAYHEPLYTEVALRLPRLPKALDGFSIVQLTDIHVGNLIERRFMDALVARTNALRPDLVAITGDLVDGSVPVLGPAVSALANLKSRAGTFFVTGNHEYYSGDRAWAAFLESIGVTVLRNRRVSVGDEASFDLVGVDDWAAGGRPGLGGGYDLDAALAGREAERAAVLLAHQPANFEVAAARGIGLQLSGHTHGGQLFPFTQFIHLAWDHVAGLYHSGEASIYVSRGCGFWGPPMRVGSPPEIVKIVLTS